MKIPIISKLKQNYLKKERELDDINSIQIPRDIIADYYCSKPCTESVYIYVKKIKRKNVNKKKEKLIDITFMRDSLSNGSYACMSAKFKVNLVDKNNNTWLFTGEIEMGYDDYFTLDIYVKNCIYTYMAFILEYETGFAQRFPDTIVVDDRKDKTLKRISPDFKNITHDSF